MRLNSPFIALLLIGAFSPAAMAQDGEERAELPAGFKDLAEKKLDTSAGFDQVTGALNYDILAHAAGGYGILDFGNIRIAFRGWEMDGEHGSSHMHAFLYPRDRTRSGLSPRDDVHGGGQRKYTLKTAGKRIEISFAETSFLMFDSQLDLGKWAKGVEFPGGSPVVRFTGDRLIVVVNESKKIEGIYKWPKE